MGLFDGINKFLGIGGGGPGPTLDQSKFDLSKQSKKYEDLLDAQRAQQEAQNAQLTGLLTQQATGQGPLANAALRTAQNRNLAQTLAMAQAQPQSALATRQLLQQRGQSSRDLAELGMQNRLQSQQALGGQLAQQANMQNQNAQLGFNVARAPVDTMKEYEQTRFGADVAKTNAIKAQQAAIGGALLSAAGQLGGAALGKPPTKASGGMVLPANNNDYGDFNVAAAGTIVRGKEVEPDDSEANDVVPHLLSAGEMVIPKTVVKQGSAAVSEFAKKLLEIEQKHGPNQHNGFAALVSMKSKLKKDK